MGRYRQPAQFAWIAFTIHNVPLEPAEPRTSLF